MRHAFQANQLLSRFTDLPPPASLSVNDLPEINTISIPPAPPYLTPEQYAKKCNIAPAVANMTITRVVNNWNGSAANIITLALAVVQLAVRTKAMVSEGIRAMEEARGQIGIIAAEARTQVSLLEEAHKQVVSISNNMQSAANAINELLVQAKQLPGNITTLSQLSENQRHTIKELHRWRRIAETFSNATVR